MPRPPARKTTGIVDMYFLLHLAVTNNVAKNQEGPSIPSKFTPDNLQSITGKLFEKVILKIVPKVC
jgi:hypothetical protein